MRQAREYLASHPELYQQALERAKRMGYADPHCSNLSTDAMLTVLGGLAEFERHLIVARTTEGRQRAQQRGVSFGRKPKLTAYQQQEALARKYGPTAPAASRYSPPNKTSG